MIVGIPRCRFRSELGRKAVAPQQIEAEVSWTFGSKRFKEVISIAVE